MRKRRNLFANRIYGGARCFGKFRVVENDLYVQHEEGQKWLRVGCSAVLLRGGWVDSECGHANVGVLQRNPHPRNGT